MDACFLWSEGGALSFRADLIHAGRPPHDGAEGGERFGRGRGRRSRMRAAVRVKLASLQLVPGRWHTLEAAVRNDDWSASAWCDGTCIYDAGGATAERFGGGAAGLSLSVFRRTPA